MPKGAHGSVKSRQGVPPPGYLSATQRQRGELAGLGAEHRPRGVQSPMQHVPLCCTWCGMERRQSSLSPEGPSRSPTCFVIHAEHRTNSNFTNGACVQSARTGATRGRKTRPRVMVEEKTPHRHREKGGLGMLARLVR